MFELDRALSCESVHWKTIYESCHTLSSQIKCGRSLLKSLRFDHLIHSDEKLLPTFWFIITSERLCSSEEEAMAVSWNFLEWISGKSLVSELVLKSLAIFWEKYFWISYHWYNFSTLWIWGDPELNAGSLMPTKEINGLRNFHPRWGLSIKIARESKQ